MSRKAATPQDGLKKRLEDLLKRPDNATCADCPERGPRWASATLGTFICIKCSGIHRNLGVHISFVRSVNLDEWKVEHVEKMEQWGNGRARAYYEAEVPTHYQRPSDWSNVQQMTRWIKDKYEHKRFVPRDGSVPDASTPPHGSSSATSSPAHDGGASQRERKPRDRTALGRDVAKAADGAGQPSRAPSSRGASPVTLPPPTGSGNGDKYHEGGSTTSIPQNNNNKPKKVVDLLDFSEPDPPTPPPPAHTHTHTQVNGVDPSMAQQQFFQPQQPQQAGGVQGMTSQMAQLGLGGGGPPQSPLPQQQQQQQMQQQMQMMQQQQVELTSSGKPKLTADQLLSMLQNPQPAMGPSAAWGPVPPGYGQPQPQSSSSSYPYAPTTTATTTPTPPPNPMMGGAYGGGYVSPQQSVPMYHPQHNPQQQQHTAGAAMHSMPQQQPPSSSSSSSSQYMAALTYAGQYQQQQPQPGYGVMAHAQTPPQQQQQGFPAAGAMMMGGYPPQQQQAQPPSSSSPYGGAYGGVPTAGAAYGAPQHQQQQQYGGYPPQQPQASPYMVGGGNMAHQQGAAPPQLQQQQQGYPQQYSMYAAPR